MFAAEIARCADCYAVSFQDEMNRCPAGHWVCPECACDCAVLEHTRGYLPALHEVEALQAS